MQTGICKYCLLEFIPVLHLVNTTASFANYSYLFSISIPPGLLSISGITYESALQTVICTSTGGPVTSVTWSRDNVPIDITDRTTYQHSQVVTDTSTATYQSSLTFVDKSATLSGTYHCSVSNARRTVGNMIEISSE